MIEIPVLDIKGEKVGSEQLDPVLLGGRVRYDLLKQAVVSYRANLRQGTVGTKSRAMVDGASRKLYKQKGTGRARAGNLRTPVRVGGGHAFHKIPRDFSIRLPRQMRRLARDSAFLAKAMAGSLMIVKGIEFDKPQTAKMSGILKAAKVNQRALLTVAALDPNMEKSVRNIPNVEMKLVAEVNAYDVLRSRSVVFTPEAFKVLTARSQ